ncbi:galactose oxidase [Lophiostoma macrostomum CBS 122681]|uniref:Galactose oxidase n=1 Tax=Lophiostoma macrostomum CBS 122681 TaxID=1314788 RepID=A0A6A6SNS7_9PLEO|nr:galactose oxidase [Lophiostoma macrostomum CBS 122681]
MPVNIPARPISTLKGTWTRIITEDRLRRSSQVLTAIGQDICIFGGEVLPRQPVDDQVDVVSLSHDAPRLETKSLSVAPTPRVGSASANLNGRMYLFSGRGGTDMAPLEEKGAVWNYDPVEAKWNKIMPADISQPYPPARSYHCATAGGESGFYIHAGCPADGRLSDLWKFDVWNRSWIQLPDAPLPHRGGASIAYSNNKLYRMNGFDGTQEQGGSIDIFDLDTNTWSSKIFQPDGNDGPEARSVSVLLPFTFRNKAKLLTLFGERDPSSLGHAGAGKMLDDVWVYDIYEEWWTKIPTAGDDGVPDPRGWFDADVVEGTHGPSVVVHGGLGEDNERLGDIWLMSFPH